MAGSVLILTAGMGAGHDVVADELAKGLTAAGCDAFPRDVLAMLPAHLGRALSAGYRACIDRLPACYELLYRAMFQPGSGRRPGGSALWRLAEPSLRAALRETRADRVVSVFHLGAQITGELRRRGRLAVPAAVYVLDFVPHRQWIHPGNDLYLLLTRDATDRMPSALRDRSRVCGALPPPRFREADPLGRTAWRARLEALAPGRPAVLVSAGAWGVADDAPRTCALLRDGGFLPVVLCGHNSRLQRQLERQQGLLALPWEPDLPGLMHNCHALIDNAAGQTAIQALAAGLPVVGYRPIAGHGREGVARMAALGMSDHAGTPAELLRMLDALHRPDVREARLQAAEPLFRQDPATELKACWDIESSHDEQSHREQSHEAQSHPEQGRAKAAGP